MWVLIFSFVLCIGWQVQPVGSLLSRGNKLTPTAALFTTSTVFGNTPTCTAVHRETPQHVPLRHSTCMMASTSHGSRSNPFAQHHFRKGKTRIVVITPQHQPSVANVQQASSDTTTTTTATTNSTWSYFQMKPNQELVPWKEVLEKLNEKLYYDQFNDKYDKQDMEDIVLETVYLPPITTTTDETDRIMEVEALDLLMQYTEENVPIVILLGLQSIPDLYVASIRSLCRQAHAVTSFQCDESFQALEYYGEYNHRQPKWRQRLQYLVQRIFRFRSSSTTPTRASNTKRQAENSNDLKEFEEQFNTFQREGNLDTAMNKAGDEESAAVSKDRYEAHHIAYDIIQDMWQRKSIEDLLFMLYVLLDSFSDYPIKSVQAVTNSANTNLKQIKCMCQNCAKEMANCFKDPQCRKALDCLNKCKGNDQVCAYRCITSYESETFQAFANCILQKNNCMGNKALMPVYPDPRPLEQFRGQALTWEAADQIFIGFLEVPNEAPNPLVDTSTQSLYPWSWKVVCGQNPAYDTFAAQHQIFYPNRNHSTNASYLWYDPVFQVTTLSGEEVWRRRHYFVRRAKLPGQYFFTVLDNGVRSNELWRILDCADDLSWAVLYYSGAASVAGISYQGSLIVTPDGNWPNMTTETKDRIYAALARGKISPWELFEVNWNITTTGAPLGVVPMSEQQAVRSRQ